MDDMASKAGDQSEITGQSTVGANLELTPTKEARDYNLTIT